MREGTTSQEERSWACHPVTETFIRPLSQAWVAFSPVLCDQALLAIKRQVAWALVTRSSEDRVSGRRRIIALATGVTLLRQRCARHSSAGISSLWWSCRRGVATSHGTVELASAIDGAACSTEVPLTVYACTSRWISTDGGPVVLAVYSEDGTRGLQHVAALLRRAESLVNVDGLYVFCIR